MTPDESFDQLADLLQMLRVDALPPPHRLTLPGYLHPGAPLTVTVSPHDVDAWRPFLTITAETSTPLWGDPGWVEWRVEARLKTAAETPVVLVAAVKVARPVASVGRP